MTIREVKLAPSSLILFAMHHYDNPHLGAVEEFEEDLKRLQYIKKLFRRYDRKGELRERLIINHMVILYNCFGHAANDIMLMQLEEYHHFLKPFMVFLNYMPTGLVEYSERRVDINKVESDKFIIERLKQI